MGAKKRNKTPEPPRVEVEYRGRAISPCRSADYISVGWEYYVLPSFIPGIEDDETLEYERDSSTKATRWIDVVTREDTGIRYDEALGFKFGSLRSAMDWLDSLEEDEDEYAGMPFPAFRIHRKRMPSALPPPPAPPRRKP